MSKLRLHTKSLVFQTVLYFSLSFSTFSVAASIGNPALQQCVPLASWVSLEDQSRTQSVPDYLSNLGKQRVVLLGETHSNAEHHRWQLDTIAALHVQRPDMVLGFEMFPRRAQPVLNRWVAGELSEEEFLSQTHWKEVWNYDSSLYLPIFHFARRNGIPMLALNIDRSLIGVISEKGWDNVPLTLREGVSDPAAPSQAYVEYLYSVFLQHTVRFKNKLFAQADTRLGLDTPNFRRFLAGQLVWDRAMAEAIGMIAQAKQAPLIVNLIGSGHLMYRHGVPHQLAALGIDRTSVVLPWDQTRNCSELGPQLADAVFGIGSPAAFQVDNASLSGRPTEPEVNEVFADSASFPAANAVDRVTVNDTVEAVDIVTP